MRHIAATIFTLITIYTINAQHICGTSHAAQLQAVENIKRFRANPILEARGDQKLYLPITFHRVARNSGKGAISTVKVIEQFDRLRKDLAPINIVPYIKQIVKLKNDLIYSKVSSNSQAVANQKDGSSANIFLTHDINLPGGNGTILGYFDPRYDFVVVRKASVGGTNTTMTHELGHFFSLPHTFFGWELEPYEANKHGNPLQITVTPETNIPIELMDRSNCDSAADAFCDTPPDYNFGFTADGCALNSIILDSNKDTIETMAHNFMSYFSGCKTMAFTAQQRNAMRSSFLSDGRSYLRSDYVPDTTLIGDYKILSNPETMGEHYNNVHIDWEDAPGATKYAVSITPFFSSEQYFIVDKSELTLTNLRKNELHIVRIRAFNEGSANAPTKEFQFKTGKAAVSTEDTSYDQAISVYPNPVASNSMLHVHIPNYDAANIQYTLYDTNGRLIQEGTTSTASGSTFQIGTAEITTGLYILKIKTRAGSVYRRIHVR